MKCPKCDVELEYDEVSNTYYCEVCSHLYSEDEIAEQVKLYRLTPFMCIPILNVILLGRAKDNDERRVYTNTVISSILMMLIYCFAFLVVLYKIKDTTINNFRVEARQYMETTITTYDPSGIKPRVFEFKGIEVGDKPTEEEQVYELNDEVVRLLADSSVTGETLKHIVNKYPAYSYLVQTLSCVQKYQDLSYYFCIGHSVREANNTSETSNITFYVGDLEGTFTQLPEVIDASTLEEEKTIMYIYESQRFNVTPIYDKYDNVIGLAFVELEV